MLAEMLASVVSADGDPFCGERLERDPPTGDGTGAAGNATPKAVGARPTLDALIGGEPVAK